jgi:NAD(P)-dependent dehydrogenase (short-subunit alcohol dehydrogenase family)
MTTDASHARGDRSLTGKVAIVTGGGRGIGRGIARRLVELGATVVVVSRTVADVEETTSQLRDLGTVESAPCDVSDRAAARRLVAETRERHGSLDVLVCSHGVYDADSPFLEMTDEQWDRTLGINLGGSFVLGQAAAQTMVRDGVRGRIVFVSSINGIAAEPDCADYNASKSGLHGLARSMAYDLASHGITVNVVAPGWVRSPMSAPYLSEDIVSGKQRFNMVGRVGEPEDIAGAVAWLVDPASTYVTGTVIAVDGGQTAMLPMPASVFIE